jgi:short-subunit dehydrogenase
MANSQKPVVLISDVSTSAGALVAEQFLVRGWSVVGVVGSGKTGKLRTKALDLQPAEMTRSGDLERVVHGLIRRYRRIDAVIFNAGVGLIGPIESLSYSQMKEQLSVNVLSVAELIRLVVPQMVRQGSGTLVSYGNLFDTVGLPGYSLYGASKFASRGMMESLYHELGKYGIRVKMVDPGELGSIGQGTVVYGANRKWKDSELGLRFGILHRRPIRGAETTGEAVRIYAAATDGKNRFRYAGKRNRWLRICKRMLPERLYHRLVDRTMI